MIVYDERPNLTTRDVKDLKHNFALYLTSRGIPLDSSLYDAFYLYRHCKVIDFFDLLNIGDMDEFQSVAYEHLLKTLQEKSTAKGANISCYIRGITLLWKYLHGDETPYTPYNPRQTVGKTVSNEVPKKTHELTLSEELCSVNYLWEHGSENDWNVALSHYYEYLKPHQIPLEREIENLDTNEIQNLSVQDFYTFLYEKYFVWKYTAHNRLATTRMNLERYRTEDKLHELEYIKRRLFSADRRNISECLKIASEIKGLGVAGASGLLAVLFPKDFGTVDKFLIIALSKISTLQRAQILQKMNPDSAISAKNGVLLIEILREKADELNRKFNTDFWTPRKIDMVLWSVER